MLLAHSVLEKVENVIPPYERINGRFAARSRDVVFPSLDVLGLEIAIFTDIKWLHTENQGP
jgi:hypothetical protein